MKERQRQINRQASEEPTKRPFKPVQTVKIYNMIMNTFINTYRDEKRFFTIFREAIGRHHVSIN